MARTERIPTRLVLGCMIFWSTLTAFLLRVNLNLGIVSMVGRKLEENNSSSWNNASGCFISNFTDNQDEYDMPGEFAWSETVQGTILSSFFWGYLLLQLPGGRLAEVIGGSKVLEGAIVVASLMSACIPMFARIHYYLLIFARVIQGLSLGVLFPTVAVIAAHWIPVVERARFSSIFSMGGTLGVALVTPMCGLVIAYLDWPALFYLSAAQGLIFCICWHFTVYDTPALHPYISRNEKNYIEQGLAAGKVKTLPIPWKNILVSMQLWAPFIAAIGSDWGFYTNLTLGPKYLSNILGLNIKQNAVLFALPFLCRYLGGIIVAQVLELCLRKKYLTLDRMRRVAACISHLLPGLALFFVPKFGCDFFPAVALICLAMAGNGAITSGHGQAFMDIAPNFAGTLSGFTNGLCSLTGIISPLIIGAILEKDASVTGWRMVFTMSATIYASSVLLFLVFFTARVQRWNDPQGQNDNSLSDVRLNNGQDVSN